MNALTKTSGGALVTEQDGELLRIMRDTLYPGARLESVEMVLGYCRARGLDPLLKPVHIVPMSVKIGDRYEMRDVPLPGINLYRIQAHRSGEYDGKTEPEYGPDISRNFDGLTVTFPAWCKVTVYRNGKPYPAKEMWIENYATARRDSPRPNTMWAKRPYGQLQKCAEAQALRMAFPELVGSDPTAEEMEGKPYADDEPREVPNTQPPGESLREVAQQVEASRQRFTVIAPSGDEHPIPVGKFLKACVQALNGLESADDVRAWARAMQPHIEAAGTLDPILPPLASAAIIQRTGELERPPEEPPQEPAE